MNINYASISQQEFIKIIKKQNNLSARVTKNNILKVESFILLNNYSRVYFLLRDLGLLTSSLEGFWSPLLTDNMNKIIKFYNEARIVPNIESKDICNLFNSIKKYNFYMKEIKMYMNEFNIKSLTY